MGGTSPRQLAIAVRAVAYRVKNQEKCDGHHIAMPVTDPLYARGLDQTREVLMRTPSDVTITAICDHGAVIYAVVLVLSLVSWVVIPA